MELGSEYSLDLNFLNVVEDNLYDYLKDYNYELFDSGRSAIRAFLRCGKFDRSGIILLPEFICESVIHCFEDYNIVFYRIRENLQIDLEDIIEKMKINVSVVFIIHYFGCIQSSEILNYIYLCAVERGITILEDATHSLFSKKCTIGDYVVASIRKWMPIPMGGILYSRRKVSFLSDIEKSMDNQRLYGMILKQLYLKNEIKCNSVYRSILQNCEKKIEQTTEIRLISDLCRFIISCISIKHTISMRKENYRFVKAKLKEEKLFPVCELAEDECPFVFPLRVPDRDGFRQYLIGKKIYCAVHWPFDYISENMRVNGKWNAQTLISLPIDQRYGREEMRYLVDTIKAYGGELLF